MSFKKGEQKKAALFFSINWICMSRVLRYILNNKVLNKIKWQHIQYSKSSIHFKRIWSQKGNLLGNSKEQVEKLS